MKKNLITAVLMTLVTTVLFGLLFPLLITGLAQLLFPKQANGELITKNNKVVGSRLIGQTFSSAGYFHSRPSNAGTGYDAGNSGA
jgi:K+-transporting ATPase ATPase C chain